MRIGWQFEKRSKRALIRPRNQGLWRDLGRDRLGSATRPPRVSTLQSLSLARSPCPSPRRWRADTGEADASAGAGTGSDHHRRRRRDRGPGRRLPPPLDAAGGAYDAARRSGWHPTLSGPGLKYVNKRRTQPASVTLPRLTAPAPRTVRSIRFELRGRQAPVPSRAKASPCAASSPSSRRRREAISAVSPPSPHRGSTAPAMAGRAMALISRPDDGRRHAAALRGEPLKATRPSPRIGVASAVERRVKSAKLRPARIRRSQ
jgi:hypothetical protein